MRSLVSIQESTISALENTYQDSDIDLRPIKGAITSVELPDDTLVCSSKLIEGFLEAGLSAIPGRNLTHELVRASGQLQLECETQHAIERAHKVEEIGDLLFDLVLAAD